MKTYFSLVLVCLLTACNGFCDKEPNHSTIECKTYRVLLSCGPKTGIIVLQDLADIMSLDYTKILADIFAVAPSEYACAEAAIESGLKAKFGVGSPQHEAFVAASSAQHLKMSAAKAKQ